MAFRIFRVCELVSNTLRNNTIKSKANAVNLIRPSIPLVQSTRDTNFFSKKSADTLWKSVTSVSNAGKRRGRGKGLPRIKDLNRGQRIGFGKVAMTFPGLNANVLTSGTAVTERSEVFNERKIGTQLNVKKRIKLTPLERGWSGGRMNGRKIGPPDPVDGEPFIGFQSWIMYFSTKNTMTSVFGRRKRCTAIVFTGNGNGLGGFAVVSAGDMKTVLRKANNKAGQRVMYFERYEEHTVLHDFYAQFGRTKIFVSQKHKGYGLKCHRIIRTICEAIGIKDLYAKVEGSVNPGSIIKAFLIGLLRQKTHQTLANEKKLYLVEMKRETNYFPKVVATPDQVRSKEEVKSGELLDFKQYVMDGRVVLRKKIKPLFYTKLPSYSIYLRKQERQRNQHDVRIRLRAEYGEICSFLTEKYPEARPSKWKKHKPEETAE